MYIGKKAMHASHPISILAAGSSIITNVSGAPSNDWIIQLVNHLLYFVEIS